MIKSLIPQASSFAGEIDNLILLVTVITMAWFFAAQAIFFGFIFKFREKPGQKALHIDGYNPLHKRWITYPHNALLVFDVIILVFAVKAWNHVKIDQPTPNTTVQVIGQRWAWTFVHAGKDNTVGTADDIKTADELHVKLGDIVRFEGTSRDVLHSFSVPAFRLKQDMIPGRVNSGWFQPTMAGTFTIQCTEICGIGHGVMAASIVVHPAEPSTDAALPVDYATWMAANAPAGT